MNPRRYDAEPPRAQELAAYVDGELTAAERQRVEEWLAEHPESAAEVQTLRRLHGLLHAHGPHEPAEAEWAAVLQRIEQGMTRPRLAGSPNRGRRLWLAFALGASAAAVLLALALGFKQKPDEVAVRPVPVEPFPVVSASDVEITSVGVADTHALAVGEIPMPADIVLVAAGDVALRSVESDPQWGFPDMHMNTQGNETPMIYAPLAVDIKLP